MDTDDEMHAFRSAVLEAFRSREDHAVPLQVKEGKLRVLAAPGRAELPQERLVRPPFVTAAPEVELSESPFKISPVHACLTRFSHKP